MTTIDRWMKRGDGPARPGSRWPRGTRMVVVAGLILGAGLMRMPAETVELSLSVRDDTGRPMPALVWLRDGAGRSCLPPVALTVNLGPDPWFVCDGHARVDVPVGEYRIRVERGPEYRPDVATIDVRKNTSHEFRLHHWIDMQARGYRSGEDHLHIPAVRLPELIHAADLDFGSSLYWWNGPNLPRPPHAATATCTLYDSEVENAWGALYSLGPREPMPVPWDPARSNLPYAAAARKLGALNCYQGGWSREVLVDALLGEVDVVNVNDNIFQRFKFMPRARNANLLDVPDLPTYPDTAEGMLQMVTGSYYRLLNCGLHLAAGAGSATGVKSTPPGYNRTYVRVGPHATVREFLEGWRRGRNFVTTGPMLFLTATDGREPGDTIALPAGGGAVRVRAQAAWDGPLRSLAIIVNGQVAASTARGELETTLEIHAGSWIAALATAEDGPEADTDPGHYVQASPLGGERPTHLRFAQTSPIYVTVAGAGAHVAESVAEARRMLDAFAVFARQTAAPPYQAEILDAVAAARRRLETGAGP